MTNRRNRKRIFRGGLGMVLLGAMLGLTGFVSSPAGALKPDKIEVTLCHRTNSVTNPYRVITVSVDGTNGEFQGPDHTGHTGAAFDFSADPAVAYPPPHSGDQWGDVIPPYSWTGGSYPGLNWPSDIVDPEAIQAFLDAGCNPEPPPCEVDCSPGPPAGRLTLEKVTAGNNQPNGVADTPFDFSVECTTDAGSVPDATPSLTPADGTTDVASGLDNGDTCTVAETSSSPDFTTTFSVDGGSAQAGPVEVSFIDPEQVIAVVVTNTYNAERGCTNCAPPPTPTPTPTAQLSASVACSSGGLLVTVVNAGDAPGTLDVTNDGTPVSQGVSVAAGGSQAVLVPVAEDAAYSIVAGASSFTGTRDCEAVQGVVITPAPTVAGEVLTAPAALPRTGASTLPMVQWGAGLMMLGLGALLLGREHDALI